MKRIGRGECGKKKRERESESEKEKEKEKVSERERAKQNKFLGERSFGSC